MWQTRAELTKTRNRQLTVVVVLAALVGLLCLVMVTSDKNGGDSAIVGILFIELVLMVPLLFGARRVARTSRLIARVDTIDDEDQRAESDAMRVVDETVWRAGRLVAALKEGAARSSARDALATAETARAEFGELVSRLTQLEHLVETAHSGGAKAALERARDGCRDDADQLSATIEDLAAELATLVDEVSDVSVDAELGRLQAATERVSALVDGLREVKALDG